MVARLGAGQGQAPTGVASRALTGARSLARPTAVRRPNFPALEIPMDNQSFRPLTCIFVGASLQEVRDEFFTDPEDASDDFPGLLGQCLCQPYDLPSEDLDYYLQVGWDSPISFSNADFSVFSSLPDLAIVYRDHFELYLFLFDDERSMRAGADLIWKKMSRHR